MNGAILRLTVRQLLGKKRTLVLVLFALLPVALALAFRLGGGRDPAEWTARPLLSGMIVGTLLPLAALVFGTAAIGSEIEDGTAVYLLAKPIRRSAVVLSKLAVAWAATAAFTLSCVVLASVVSIQGAPGGPGIIAAFAVATLVGSLLYCALFLLMSVMTSRAFIAGLVYVFLWEALITRLFKGTRVFSVRQYTQAIARQLTDVPESVFTADLGFATAMVMTVVVGAGATVLAIRRLQRFEVGES